MIAYYAKSLVDGGVIGANERAVMPSWSTIKIVLALSFWRAVETGDLSASRAYAFQPWQAVGGSGVLRGFKGAAKMALADYVHLSLAVSDNDATNVVLSFVGLERVAAMAAELELPDTRMQRRMMDFDAVAEGRNNVTSPRDLGRLLEELVAGRRLSEAVREPVLASLALTEHFLGIPRYLPADARYAGKCGDDAPDGVFTHDCGIVRRGERRAVLAVMTDGGEGYEAIARLGASLVGQLLPD